MGWSQELNDFSEGFSSGMNMVRSREEREAEKLANERRRQEVEQFNYEKSRRPVLEGREQKLHDLDVQRQEGAIDQQEWEKQRREIIAGQQDTLFELGAERERGTLEQQGYERGRRPVLEGREQQLHDLDVRFKEGSIDQQEYDKSRRDILAGREQELHELDVEGKKELISGGKEDTRGKKLANDKLQKQQDLFDAYQKRRGGRKTLQDEDAVPAAPAPGPQSSRAVEVPVESTATHDAVDISTEPPPPGATVFNAPTVPGMRLGTVGGMAYDLQGQVTPGSTIGPTEVAQPIEPEAEPAEAEPAEAEPAEAEPAEAEPAEAVPATPTTPAYGVPLPAGGPRAHPHVDRIQRSRAEIDTTGPQPRLDDATVNVLEAAGAQTNTRAVITSGGTGGEPASVRLYDMETNKPLDPNIPADRQRMEAFNAAAQSAPSEITTTTSPLDHTGSVYKVAREATMVGLDRAADKHGLKNQSAVDTPESEQAAYSFLSGDYGANADQVEQAKAVVQEMAAEAGHELNEAEEAIYTVAYAYDSYMAAGMYEEAKEAAAAVVGHYTKLAGQFSAVAKAAVMDGDLPAGIEAAARAYANVPDGVGVDFNQAADGRYEVVMTNEETGEVTTRSIMTPQEIGGLIMKIDPSHFLSTMSQAAGKDLEETLSAEAAEQMGRPELAGLSRKDVATIQAEEKENRLRGGGAVEVGEDGAVSVGAGKSKKGLKPAERTEVVEGVTKAFEDFAANAQATAGKDETYLATTSDLMMDIKPIAQQVALDNFGTLEPDLAVEAVVRMVDQEPVSARGSEDGKTITISMEGVPDFTISDKMYQRLAVARARFGENEPGTQTQEEFNQSLAALRRETGPDPYALPDYDPTRGGATIVDRLRTVRRPSEAGPEFGPGEAVPTRPVPRRPIVQAPPAVGGAVEIPDWFPIHQSVRNVGGGGGPRKPQRLIPVR